MSSSLAINSFRFDNEQHWFEMMLAADQFTSVNSLYGINRRTGAIYMLAAPRHMKETLQDQLTVLDPVSQCPWISPDMVYSVEYNFVLKSEFWKRDIDNMIKVVQDAVFECLHVNDSHIIEVRSRKMLRAGDNEYLILRVGESNFDYMQLGRK